MPVAAAGPESIAIEALRTLVANSATFRSWVGAADVAAALLRIHVWGELDPKALARPYATAAHDPDGGLSGTLIGRGAGNSFEVSGKLLLQLVADPVDMPDASQEDMREPLITFMNKTGAILREMAALSGSSGFLDMTAFEREVGPLFDKPEDTADQPLAIAARIKVTYADAWG